MIPSLDPGQNPEEEHKKFFEQLFKNFLILKLQYIDTKVPLTTEERASRFSRMYRLYLTLCRCCPKLSKDIVVVGSFIAAHTVGGHTAGVDFLLLQRLVDIEEKAWRGVINGSD